MEILQQHLFIMFILQKPGLYCYFHNSIILYVIDYPGDKNAYDLCKNSRIQYSQTMD